MSRRSSISHPSHPLLPTRKPRRQSQSTRRWSDPTKIPPPNIRLRRLILCIGISTLLILAFIARNPIEQRSVWFLNTVTPSRLHRIWNTADQSRIRWTTKCPPIVPGIHAAKWPGDWETPVLTKPIGGELGPALLMLHIFSMPNAASRYRREQIRKHHPLSGIPEEYRHLVEVKFIIGYPREECRGVTDETLCQGVAAEEAEIEREKRNGDLIRLEGLKDGENMDEGKTFEWIRHVGREGGREAQWVFKCDDDTLPILQNLVPFLFTLNPSVPTYVGQAWLDESFYMMMGYMYGMNWGIIKTLASAKVTEEDIQLHRAEDLRTSQLILSLPPIPTQQKSLTRKKSPSLPRHPSNPYLYIPPPSRRTGVVRVDIRGYLANFGMSDSYSGDRAFGWHNLKSPQSYEEAWKVLEKDLKKKKKEVWKPPINLSHLARD